MGQGQVQPTIWTFPLRFVCKIPRRPVVLVDSAVHRSVRIINGPLERDVPMLPLATVISTPRLQRVLEKNM